ncbi:hypothetical protein OG594_26345 [Streptomyces sp. NBC_01214]|uniref:hypothetical protein n=1 Tax=Streptomyces sp. NBC_01214 TaxID=2903777 RepID=UPI00224E533A|nr:hypothetical protein [Streptomyces sp. NBC_01214]MCX4805086.1 hypothetical protein [Streptomyces sp. NBC_01214]
MAVNTAAQRGIWLAIILLVSVCAACVAAALFYVTGAGVHLTLGVGGGAFVATATLGLAAYRFVMERSDA